MQVEIIEESFSKIAPMAGPIVSRFYELLFEADPRLRPLFKIPMEDQKRHLIAALVTIVQSLREPTTLSTYLKGLGERHVGYGVVRPDYDTVGKALIAAMREGMGAQWQEAWTAQWQEAYGVVASLMQRDSSQAA